MRTREIRGKRTRKIPPPPGPEAGYDAIIEYFHRYTPEELEEAGYLQEPSAKEIADLEASAEYALMVRSGLTVKLAPKDLQDLCRFAARNGARAESLAKRWIRQRLRDEVKRVGG